MSVFTKEERATFQAYEDSTVSECATAHRILSEKETAEPGPWDNSRTPYLVDIMDAMGDPWIRQVVIKKPAQCGVSESTRNALLYWTKYDSGPCLIVFPDQQSCEEQIEERLKPLIKNSLQEETTEKVHDLSLKRLRLTTMDVYVGWATSPQRLASRPVRYLIFDEVNKYVDWSGKDADPVALGKARTRTWRKRSKIVILSTPTTSDANVSVAFEDCVDRRVYQIPCKHCGGYFGPTWSRVKFPKAEEGETSKKHGARIKNKGLAWIECPVKSCGGEMSEQDRLRAIKKGRWVSIDGDPQKPESVGFQFSIMSTAWCDLSELVAKFLGVKGDPKKLMEFINQDLGEDFEERLSAVSVEVVTEKSREGLPQFVVPKWAGLVLSSVDTQKDHFYYVTRAWGRGFSSKLLDRGMAASFKELKTKTLDSHFPVENDSTEFEVEPMSPQMLCIDGRGGHTKDGSRTDQVYRWSQTDTRIRPVLGHGGTKGASTPIRMINTNYTPPGVHNSYKVIRYIVDVGYFKDILSGRMNGQSDEDIKWQVFEGVGDDYCQQMASEHKVISRRGRKVEIIWMPKSKHAANHYWDCETYNTVAAVMAGVEYLPETETLLKNREVSAAKRVKAKRKYNRPKREPDKDPWVDGKGWNGPDDF